MDFFRTAKTVKLRSRHHKYLIADDNEETVSQGRNGSSKQAKWTVEFAEYPTPIVRFKSCFNSYLTATDQHFLLGMTGQKVLQTVPSRVDSSVEWEPLWEGAQVKLKTRHGKFLRANGGLPPWRNSITHDIPHCSATKEWILWNVEELVMSRSIYNIVYRQEHARIYDETPITCGTNAATNDSNQEDTMTMLIEYSETTSTSWENSNSLSQGASSAITVGVPYITDGKINFNVNATRGHKWGGKEDVSVKRVGNYTAKVGPKKQVKVSYVASKGTCHVPFSYTQEDVFTDGTRQVTVHNDGMFTGTNCYNYKFNKQENPL